ncbi:MAG: hypothetical protein L0Y44_10615 [Phycisphaerales bacterium]|nr:hypothetical protein [Phycisphaerales bacterium]MCI0675288.1 hypothetical protein [Phycisphaerales bacterium]
MTTSHRRIVLVILTWAVGSGGPLTAPTRADVVTAIYNGPTNFSYQITHMPDLDQRRSLAMHPNPYGLPGNGSMYCVPTSTMNMIMYVANHGFPAVAPGPGNWQSNALYNDAGEAIDTMGILMNTSASGGTGGNDAFNATKLWMDWESGKFTVTAYFPTQNFTPYFSNLTETAICGSLISLAFGRYTVVDDGSIWIEVGARNGGHAMTYVKGSSNGFNHTFAVRDPADDGTNSTQSQFVNREFDAWNYQIMFCPQGQNCYTRYMTALNYTEGDELIRLIDGYMGIRPKSGYGFTNTGIIMVYAPWLLNGSNGDQIAEYTVSANANLQDVAIDPDLVGYVALVPGAAGAQDTIKHFNPLTGQSEVVGQIPGADKLVFGRKRNLYVLSNTGLLHMLEIPPDPQHPPDPLVELPSPVEAMTYDDVKDEVVLLSVPDRRLLRYPDGLADAPTFLNIPDEVMLGGGEAGITLNPVDGKYWIVTEGSNTIYGLQQNAAGGITFEPITMAGIQHPTGIDADDAGHLFVTTNGGVVELQKNAAGAWQMVADGAFDGMAVGSSFRVTRSRTNFDPELHDGPAFFNIDPDELQFGEAVPDCLADLDGNFTVNVNDLLALIGNWGACEACFADITPVGGNGSVNVEDLLALIGAWGSCE